jgi:hypothetical protein
MSNPQAAALVIWKRVRELSTQSDAVLKALVVEVNSEKLINHVVQILTHFQHLSMIHLSSWTNLIRTWPTYMIEVHRYVDKSYSFLCMQAQLRPLYAHHRLNWIASAAAWILDQTRKYIRRYKLFRILADAGQYRIILECTRDCS